MHRATFGPEHPNTALSLNNMATVYLAKGDIVKAHELLAKAVAIARATLGPDHPHTRQFSQNLALARVS